MFNFLPSKQRERMELQNRATWLISIAIATFFLKTGLAKFDWAPDMVANFERWGYPVIYVQGIGLLELIGAGMLLSPRTAVAGCVLLAMLMIGAMETHVWFHEYGAALRPFILGLVCAGVGFARRPQAVKIIEDRLTPNEVERNDR